MKKFIITVIAITMMIGTVAAQDNKVKVVKQNTEMIKRAKAEKVNKKYSKMKIEKQSPCKMDSCKKASSKEGKVLPGKSLKLENPKRLPGKPQKMKAIK